MISKKSEISLYEGIIGCDAVIKGKKNFHARDVVNDAK